jgi:hypothetical protein
MTRKPRYTWENNIRNDPREIEWGGECELDSSQSG